MKNHSTYFPVDQPAPILGVSRSGYYNFINGSLSNGAIYNKELLEKIRFIFAQSYNTYGSPRIHAELLGRGYNCSRTRVARLIRDNKIQAK